MQTKLIVIVILVVSVHSSTRIQPPELSKVQMLDQSQIVRLAEQEKFRIPLTGKTITHSINYVPENQGECKYIPQSITYQSLAQSPAIFGNDDQIVAILPLKKRQIVFVADPYYNVASYSIDKHFLMKSRSPKTNLNKNIPFSGPNGGLSQIVNPYMVATQNEQFIFYLTVDHSYLFRYSDLGSGTKQIQLPGNLATITKAEIVLSYMIVGAGVSGLFVYHINETTMELTLLQKIQPEKKQILDAVIDFEFNKQTQMLYVLHYFSDVKVYTFHPDQNIPLENRIVLTLYDQIDLQPITLNHNGSDANNLQEFTGCLNIQISISRQQQSIMILFDHNFKNIVAQLNYNSEQKKFSFVRYYKYAVMVKQIHIVSNDIMLVVGDGLLGMFPYGVDPHLIDEQFNGNMALSSVDRIVLVQAPFFVGVNKNQIQYGGIFLNTQTGITCHLSSSSQLKQVKFRANLTACGDKFPLSIDKYCAYQKTFIIKQMQLTASAPIATSLWVATILCTLLLIVGLCCLFAIHKKKERQIRKLQLYFEERRRASHVPASSDRN